MYACSSSEIKKICSTDSSPNSAPGNISPKFKSDPTRLKLPSITPGCFIPISKSEPFLFICNVLKSTCNIHSFVNIKLNYNKTPSYFTSPLKVIIIKNSRHSSSKPITRSPKPTLKCKQKPNRNKANCAV